MRILYGIAGDGLGHSVRSAVVIEHLLDQGHDVRVAVSGDGTDYLSEKFSDVTEIWGLSCVTRDNQIREGLTIASNIRKGLSPSGLPRNIYKWFEVARNFDPEVVISDYEFWSWSVGALLDVPVIAVDNVHLLSRCSHPDTVVEGIRSDYAPARMILRMRVPTASHYLVSTFASPEVTERNTTLVPPILRPRILEAEPSDGDHLLVYQTSYSQHDLEATLRQLDCPVRVYGAAPDAGEERTAGNVTFRPFDEERFIEDLASCRAVVASAGFTLITEALHLGKPYLALPVGGQIEQLMNANYLEWLDYGSYTSEPDLETYRTFLSNVPSYRRALEDYERSDNSPTFEKLGSLLRRERRRRHGVPATRLTSMATEGEVLPN